MRDVPWWGVISSVLAPVLLVTGFTVAASLQPNFDQVSGTVSSLAAVGATDRWVMTLTFVVVGVCYLATALALRPAGAPGRLILAVGAVTGMLVAANPVNAYNAFPVQHMLWAGLGFAGLTFWPAGAWRRGACVPWALRLAVAATAVAVLLALMAWFVAELISGAGQAGLAERIVGTAQALWPLAVVLAARRQVSLPRGAGRPGDQRGVGQRRGTSAQHRADHHLRDRMIPESDPGPGQQPDKQVPAEH